MFLWKHTRGEKNEVSEEILGMGKITGREGNYRERRKILSREKTLGIKYFPTR